MSLFFGLEVSAPWPRELPKGRVIEEGSRHLTLAFLGKRSYEEIAELLPSFPKPSFSLAPVGRGDDLLFLPPKHPRVAAWHINWLTEGEELLAFQKRLLDWLESSGYEIDRRKLLSHVTVARAPFDVQEWKEAFVEIPVVATAIHLYQSEGNLTYRPRWSLPFPPPYEEFEHTADIAFRIRAKDLSGIFLHAQIALAYKYPPLMRYFSFAQHESLDAIIAALNAIVSKADAEIGTPFKAISYHGKIEERAGRLLHWEMIVDV